MYVRVRTVDCKSNAVITVSKLTTVEEFKEKIQESFNVEPCKQRLFYRGKQLENGYKIFDYNINLNDVIQLMIKIDLDPVSDKVNGAVASDTKSRTEPTCSNVSETELRSKYFKIGDQVDAVHDKQGAWFHGTVASIVRNNQSKNDDTLTDDGFLYEISFSDDVLGERCALLPLACIRPRATYKYSFDELKIGETVMVNYNLESPAERGYWYDFLIEYAGSKPNGSKVIWGTLYIGKNKLPLKFVELKFSDEIYSIEKIKPLCDNVQGSAQFTDRKCDTEQQSENHSIEEVKEMAEPIHSSDLKQEREDDSENAQHVMGDSLNVHSSTELQNNVTHETSSCSYCKSRPNVKCKHCGCHVCGLKDNPEKQLMCDECDMAFHLQCLNPPLEAVPDTDEWYCPLCKNDENEIVKAGGKLKESKKKLKMASSNSHSNRDWGKGMACVGRTKECTLVPPNHYGPIPGIEVGTCWKFRVQVSEAGVHRPHVAGIHGRESDGAYSIVLSGGYEDDIDNGDHFMYSGSGGRDLSGNKRTAEQSCDQTLTRMNKALAMNCNAPLNVNGAKAKDWKGGKPIRVVRNYKLRKHSKYAPEDGNRYDGIYKVVEYFPQKGKSGFIVWRYLLKRDDPTPAPWTPKGKQYMQSLGLQMIYPDGYLQAVGAIDVDKPTNETKKRKSILQETSSPLNTKKRKLFVFELGDDIHTLIKKDMINAKLWAICNESLSEGKQKFLSVVNEVFICICCQELVYEPVTTNCHHNFCLSCLKRAFKAEVYSCPCCRNNLGEEYKFEQNLNLSQVLVKLFPGYNCGR